MNPMNNMMGNMGNMGGMGAMGNIGNMFGNMTNMMNMFNQFKQNPIGAIMSMGFNIPQNVQNNPEATVNYLRNSGQMSDQQFNMFSQLAQQFGGNFKM